LKNEKKRNLWKYESRTEKIYIQRLCKVRKKLDGFSPVYTKDIRKAQYVQVVADLRIKS
jgi:hypothetical protein